MGRPIVYGTAGSTYVWSVRLALAEKGVAHELVEVGFGPHREEPHLSRHPFAKIPAFEHDGFQLYETGDRVTLADLMVIPLFYFFGRVPEGEAPLSEYPNIRPWMRRMEERQSFQVTKPPPV